MRLAADNELQRTGGIGEQGEEPLGVVEQQVGPLVGGKAAGKTCGQGVCVEEVLHVPDFLRRGSDGRQMLRHPLPHVYDERLAGGAAEVPQS
jgi:hypothetical protein